MTTRRIFGRFKRKKEFARGGGSSDIKQVKRQAKKESRRFAYWLHQDKTESMGERECLAIMSGW